MKTWAFAIPTFKSHLNITSTCNGKKSPFWCVSKSIYEHSRIFWVSFSQRNIIFTNTFRHIALKHSQSYDWLMLDLWKKLLVGFLRKYADVVTLMPHSKKLQSCGLRTMWSIMHFLQGIITIDKEGQMHREYFQQDNRRKSQIYVYPA